MDKIIKPSRTAILSLLLAALTIVYFSVLYKMQIVDKRESYDITEGTTSTTTKIAAARGSILDTNGVLLVGDRTSYNVVISYKSQSTPNDTILSLVNAANQFGVNYVDTFPVTMSAPFAYTALSTNTQDSRLQSYLEHFKFDENITAPELISWMRDHYGIDYTVTGEEARLIIGVRYEVEIRSIVNTTDYIFASDVGTEFASYLKQLSLPYVSVVTSSVREYYTEYAAHLLGHLGYISSEDYQETYKALGYSLNDLVGQNGVEYAFEQYLRAKSGSVTTYTDENGAVVNEVVTTEAQAGDNIYLTIDIKLQEVAEKSLASAITSMNIEREENNTLYQQELETIEALGTDDEPTLKYQELAEGGAVVAIDVSSGSVLACASYPTFDLSNYSSEYSSLVSDPLNPLWNRATQGTYNPGSTFKMVTALAALKAGVISPTTLIEDEGIYTKYDTYQPKCWIYPGNHGLLNVVGALENSCNYFFYTISDEEDGVRIKPIADMAAEFGFGAKTGIEIGDVTGTIASREYKLEALNEGWWNADTLMAAIGQSYNYFTPIQIANYIATIANGGTHYSATLLKYITSSDYSEVVLENPPEVLNIIDDSAGYFSVLQQGMRAVAATGTASSYFKDYEISVAAKTGTTQSDTTSMNTGVFVCYAPADNPEIAVAVVVEKGGSGAALVTIAKDILSEYFGTENFSVSYYGDNSLVR